MKKATKKILIFVGIFIIIFSGTKYASASAWWGEGARSSEWVVSHGGTVLYFEFKNIKSDKKDLKINLYTANGDVIETERGDRKGKIDDGIAGQSYYLKAKDGKKSAKSKVFTMRKGSTNYATVNMKSKNISVSLGGISVAPKNVTVQKPIIKPVDKKEIIKKKAITVIDPKMVGKFSKEKRNYNLAYNYYRIDYKKIRDNKFELKIFTFEDKKVNSNKKIADNPNIKSN